jgi:hypothetical protein
MGLSRGSSRSASAWTPGETVRTTPIRGGDADELGRMWRSSRGGRSLARGVYPPFSRREGPGGDSRSVMDADRDDGQDGSVERTRRRSSAVYFCLEALQTWPTCPRGPSGLGFPGGDRHARFQIETTAGCPGTGRDRGGASLNMRDRLDVVGGGSTSISTGAGTTLRGTSSPPWGEG